MWRKKESLSFLPPWEFQTPLFLGTPGLLINLPRNWLSHYHCLLSFKAMTGKNSVAKWKKVKSLSRVRLFATLGSNPGQTQVSCTARQMLRESFPRQGDKESRGPQGERGLEFSRRKKGQTFHSLCGPGPGDWSQWKWGGNRQEGQGSPNGGNSLQVSDIFISLN